MFLLSISTASPETRYTQKDCYEIFLRSTAANRLKSGSVALMKKVLNRNNGISTRGFCYPDIETIFDARPDELNKVFEMHAPGLGKGALASALERANLKPDELDALIVCTCTGYLCPGLSSYIAELARLRPDCELVDLVGMGCGAAIPSLRQAAHILSANPKGKVAVIAVEVCSAAFYLDDDPGVIISACLFGDGAAATIWTGEPGPNQSWFAHNFNSLHLPSKRNLLRFQNKRGYLRNHLSKDVPVEAANHVRTLYEQSLSAGLSESAIVLPHTGGRDVLDALESVFSGHDFPSSKDILRKHGNMSSPSILYVLEHHLQGRQSDDHNLWLTSFGAGFTAYSFQLSKQD
jgi:alkylresorcinol/alkylpyrone synthase